MKHKDKIEQYHLHKAHPERLQFEIYDLASYLKRNVEHASVAHSHSFYQILWFYNAGGNHYVDFDVHHIKKDTVLFISKNQIHYFDESAKHEGVIIHFNEQFLMQSDVDIFLKYNVFNTQGRPCYCITEDISVLANSYIELIKTELKNNAHFGHKQVVRYLLKSLLIVFERVHRENKDGTIKFTNHYELQYLQFRELIETHYKNHNTVSEYADLLYISSKTLSTVTKLIASKSPSELISERLILEAQRLLSFTTLKINEVAYTLGFDDASYFVKYFKRHLKQSPSDYRKLIS
ncbi:AraC family transcriptional regulator [uncultured Lacinutrix sp.]|uniref:AraC family transcriptional regulator n=1 Tax=uncultured Lacinutrix sp. TaxID=574032 RepID=UPI0026368E03|nr:AraC family transcriptional regulator [uncultured Lacinutrix sp.]